MRAGTWLFVLIVVSCLLLTLAPPAARAAHPAWSEPGVQIGAPAWGAWSPTAADGYRDASDRFLVKIRGPGILVEFVDADPTWRWQTGIALSDEGGSGWAPAFAPDGAGGFYMYGIVQNLDVITTYREHFSAATGGEDWGTPPLGVPVGSQYSSQSMLADGGGDVRLAVNDFYGDYSGGLFLQRWAANGSVLAGWAYPGHVVGNGQGMNPVLAADGAGGVLVMFQSDTQCLVTRIQSGGAIAAGWTAAGLLLGPPQRRADGFGWSQAAPAARRRGRAALAVVERGAEVDARARERHDCAGALGERYLAHGCGRRVGEHPAPRVLLRGAGAGRRPHVRLG